MKNILRAVVSWLGEHWRGIAVSIIVTVIAATTLSLQLNTLVPGQNSIESEALTTINTSYKPWYRAVNAPYTVPAHILGNSIGNPLHAARIISVVYGLLSAAALFVIIRLWFNSRAATVGVLLFITSSWLLHVTHMAAPLVLLAFGPLLVLAPFAWLLKTKRHALFAFPLLMAALAVAAYIPYMVWIISLILILLVIFERKVIRKFKTWHIVGTAALYGIILLPLLISLIQFPGQLYELAGIPKHLPSFMTYMHQLLYTVSMLVFRSAPLPMLYLGRLPMLDIFSAAMFGMGLYHFGTRLNCRRSMAILGSFGLMVLIVPLSPVYQISATVLLSLAYILIISGIVELLNQWFSYFPRNPWARNFGVALIVIAIGFASFYHLERYYIAWPNSPEAKDAYVVKSKE